MESLYNRPEGVEKDESCEDNQIHLHHRLRWVESTGRELETRPFENPEVSNRYRQIVNYNQQLILFENIVIDLLSRVENAQEFSAFINTIFEMENTWPFLITDDENFRILLSDLAFRHALEFDDAPYDKILGDRLVELRAPAVSLDLDRLGKVTYEFDVPEQFSQTVVSVGWAGVPVDVFQFALQHPDGRTLQFKLAPFNEKQYIYHIRMNHLPADSSVVTIPNEEYPALEKITGQEKDSTVGYEQDVVVIKLFPDDPILAPMDGKWLLTVTAPAGLEIIFGAAPIP